MRLRQPGAGQIQEQMMFGVIVHPIGRDQPRSIEFARVVRAWLNGSSPLELQACSAILRMRVTSDSQLAIAASQTAKKPDADAGEIKQREQQRVHREKARHL